MENQLKAGLIFIEKHRLQYLDVLSGLPAADRHWDTRRWTGNEMERKKVSGLERLKAG